MRLFSSVGKNSENFSAKYLGYIVISGMPILILGLLDDLYFRVRPIYRLFGASISSIIAIFLLVATTFEFTPIVKQLASS